MKQLKLMKTLIVAVGLLLGTSAWAATATETYNFTENLGNFSYASSHVTYSDGVWGFKSTDSWLNNRFSFADGTDNGVHRNYWTIRTFSSNGSHTGLNYTRSDKARQFAIHDLKDGDVLVFTFESTGISSFTTNIKLEGGADVLAANTPLTSDQRYVVSTSDASTTVEIMGAQYCCVTKVKIETQETETMSAPTINIVPNGTNRTVTITPGISNSFGSPVKTYYTVDGTDPTTSSSLYSTPLNITENCTVKTISVAVNGTISSVTSQEVTVGALTLATPTITKTAMADNVFTMNITHDQSALDIVPTSSTLYYQINGGVATAYTAPISVNANTTVTAYVEADGYTKSATATAKTAVLPTYYTRTMNIDFTSIESITQSESFTVDKAYNNKTSETFHNITEVSDANFGMFGTNTSGNNSFNLKNGLYNQWGGPRPIGLQNMIAGDIIRIRATAEPSYTGTGYYFTNCSALTGLNYNDYYHYEVTADGGVSIPIPRSHSVKSIEILHPTSTIIGAKDNSTVLTNWIMGSDIVLANNTAKTVTFQNHGSTAQNYSNFMLRLTYNGAFFEHAKADWITFDSNGTFPYAYANSTDGGETYGGGTNFTNFRNDMTNSEVVLKLSHLDGYLYIIGTMTKGNNVYYYNYVYGDGTKTENFQVNLTVDNAWLEVVSVNDDTPSSSLVHPTAISAGKVGATGYSTFASTFYPLNLSAITGAEAYYAESINASSVTIKPTNASVPAGEGLLLKGTADTPVTINISDEGTTIPGNKLVGCITNTNLDANANYYVLVNNGGTAEFQSLATNGAKIPAGKAYLNAGATNARSLSIVFDENETGIKKIESAAANKENGAYYNLAGQRVAQPTKGLYIVNGKKVVIK